MSSQGSATKDETTKLENSTYNILIALGKEARFLYSAIDTYIDDARKDNMLRDALDKQAKEQKLH
jgi:hypothetical protein